MRTITVLYLWMKNHLKWTSECCVLFLKIFSMKDLRDTYQPKPLSH